MEGDIAQFALLLVLGLLQLFFGYPLFRVLVVLVGATIGFAYGPALLTGVTGRPVEPWMALSAAVVVGLVLGALAWLAFWAVVFLWGAAVGYSVVDPYTVTPLLPLLASFVVGVLAVLFQRLLIIALTALSGAWLTVMAASALLGLQALDPPLPAPSGPLPLVAILVLAAIGAVTQFRRSELASAP